MKRFSLFKRLSTLFIALSVPFFMLPAAHAQFSADLSLDSSDIQAPGNVVAGSEFRIYATVHNNSSSDLGGTVKFYDEFLGQYLGVDQPVSVLAGATDDVFIDWTASTYGRHDISVRVFPWNNSGDNPGNNKGTVTVFVDVDTDGDGFGDGNDGDDDDDGVGDAEDAFPKDPSEQYDSDRDGIGDNADTDDDNDGIADAVDLFPYDPLDSKDTDGDGIGDNADAFPENPTEWKDADADGLGDNADPNNENAGPQAVIEVSTDKIRTNKIITFNALKSRDIDGEIQRYDWTFEDGTKMEGVLVEHVFKEPGEQTVTLRVTDDAGEYRESKRTVQVRSKTFILGLIVIFAILLVLLLTIPHLTEGRMKETIHSIPESKPGKLEKAKAKKPRKKKTLQRKKK